MDYDDWGHVPRKKKSPHQPAASPDVPIPRKKSKQMVAPASGDCTVNHSSNSGADAAEPPRLERSGSESTATGRSRQNSTSIIRIVSEQPFIISIQTKGLHLDRPSSSSNNNNNSNSNKKRQRQSIAYKELDDTDSDDVLTEAEEHRLLLEKRNKKRRKKVAETRADQASQEDIDALLRPIDDAVEEVQDPNQIESPPPGTLSTLWYSQERFVHVWAVEKICGWKTRPKVHLVVATLEKPADAEPNTGETNANETETEHREAPADVPLSPEKAAKLQHMALSADEFWTDPKRRMEISRINPRNCPFVMTMAANDNHALKIQPVPASDAKVSPDRVDITQGGTREEVLLIKWRGRSHLHCSWERASDIQRMDPSASNTARIKVRRFYQSQEQQYGINWKQFLEEERNTTAAIHHHGVTDSADDDVEPVEEYFSPQCLEVERIMGCDENEMDMSVLATQRALNIIKEQEDLEKVEKAPSATVSPVTFKEVAWDPEDNVCYVVKWKGLPYTEMTWEYWRNIKRYAVDEAEDFWYRQRAPSLSDAQIIANRPHPHMREFKKLQESPKFGISSKPRPIAQIEGHEDLLADGNGDSDPGFRLRSYQLEGVNWLLFNWWNHRSCILADEMGLGKTIQSAAFLQELQSQPAAQVRGPFLIVAPLSLVGQWESELKAWAPDMNVMLYHGSADARNYLAREEFYYTDQFIPKPNAVKLKKLHITKFHVLITTYEVVLKDVSLLSKIRWRSLLVDEAHRLKNHRSKLFEELASVPRDHCVLLTGTPIANATEELWALLHFANPDTFSDRESFLEKFGEMTDANQVNELHALLKPYLLRRVKDDVEKSLPNKEETILEVSLTPIQKKFYKAIYEKNTAFLFKGAKPNNAPSLMNVMMELRKCCNHPFLVKGAEDRILKEAAAKLEGKKDNDGNIPSVNYGKLFEEQLVKSSGKMVLIEKLLQKLFNGGHKVLIFSQMVRVLDLLEELLKIKKYRYERLDGTTSSSSRLHAVERFKQKACQRFVMLLSTRAGGLGLNLTAADIVIIFDSDWNPQNDLQAMARAHRIGQTKAVKVYRLLTAKTYEMHMFHSASLKLGLERAVLSQNREQNDESDDNLKPTKKSEREAQAKEIDELLKKGAYDVFRDDDDQEAEQFMETNIDQLLEKSSKKVTYGASSTSSLGSGLGSFSKASFVANTEEGEKDVDLDDPDFWSKAVGLDAPPEEQPEEIAAMLDDGVKRQRKQVQQYDPYKELAEEEELRKERIALEKMMEREEKEKRREEKRRRKQKAKDEKKKKEEATKPKVEKSPDPLSTKKPSPLVVTSKLPKLSRDVKPPPKSSRKNARMLAHRRAADADPVIEKMKQAWEIPQRNRATAAAMRFGFGRFCKVRSESNLFSLPIQDLEIFVRAYLYQLTLQVSATLMSRVQAEPALDVGTLICQWIGATFSQNEGDWIVDSVRSVILLHFEVEQGSRGLRIPSILAEPVYVGDLRHGAGFRALRRLCTLTRLNCFIEDCIDAILFQLGHEELGRRGCGPNNLGRIDVDLNCRFVSTEELALVIASKLSGIETKSPATWWDRSCDVGLIIGTFVHGLGSYKAMLNDKTLPFAEKIAISSEQSTASLVAARRYLVAARATRQVFDDALEAGRVKAELEVQAAVAAAAKAAAEREAAAARVRMGGEEAEVASQYLPETQVEDAFKFDGTDSHFVTLPRMHRELQNAMRKGSSAPSVEDTAEEPVADEGASDGEEDRRYARHRENNLLPMPDARVLDFRVQCLLNTIEDEKFELISDMRNDVWKVSDVVHTNIEVRTQKLSVFMKDASLFICEYSGVGLGGFQCGTSHRKLNDGSDYIFGSGSMQLSQLAYGTDAPRYLRALGVPMNMTRFAISGLLYADKACVDNMLEQEHLRYYGADSNGDKVTSNGDIDPEPVESDMSPKETETNGSVTPVGGDPARVASDETQSQSNTEVGEDDESDASSSDSDSPSTLDPVEFMAEVFRNDAKLRANVCVAALIYGVPRARVPAANTDIWEVWAETNGVDDSAPISLFDQNAFRKAVVSLAPELEVPPVEALMEYVESFLLPHCLRLCIAGNGPSTRNARGSHGDYETAFGISIYPEPSQPKPSPIPDPFLRLQEHSLEALGYANAILRRLRLLRTCTFLCSTDYQAPADTIMDIARSKSMRELQDQVPIWWCPWKHDIGLLLRGATQGLFTLSADRSDDTVFSDAALKQQIQGTFVDSSTARIPPSVLASWVDQQVNQFPTVFQMERRLGSLCSLATTDLEGDERFEFLPMFDHGGWPRN